MVMATTDRPLRAADMGRTEAEQVTQAIKDNFDSLGAMLAMARDRKAYKALGYRSFETYCQSEFGKNISSAYQLIEDAKVLSQLEARISENYGEDITIKIPSSHLKPLKEIDNIDDKLKALEYATKLAESESRKPTKKDLEIAVFQVSGKRSEDFRAAIQGLGFSRGVQVEVFKSLNRDRGFVTKIDKGGKIHIEFHYGGNAAIPYDAADLRILSGDEQPAKPLNEDITNKGDRVLIFSPALKGKEGTIFQWKSGKKALVSVDGENSSIDIAYAEMELVKSEDKNPNWEANLVWEVGKNTYYYTPDQSTIYSDKWPHDLSINTPPNPKENSPAQFMQVWEEESLNSLLESFMTPARAKTLALAQAIELPEGQGQEFAADLIASLLQLFPAASPEPIAQKALGISFAQTVDELVSGKKTQTRRAWQDDYAKSFIRYFEENIAIPALDKGRHRGGRKLGFIKLTQRPYQQYLSQMSATDLQAEGGMVATAKEFIDEFFEGQDKLVWVLHFEFLSTPASNNTDEVIVENQRLREQLAEAETVIHSSQLAEENQQLREQLAEAETAIQSMIAASTPSVLASALEPDVVTDFLLKNPGETSSPGEAAPGNDFLLENTSETASLGEAARHPDSWKQLLENNGFTPVPYELEGFYKGSWRGWKLFFCTPNGGITAIDIANQKEEMFARCTEVDFDIDLGDEEALINWTRGIINQVEDFCPGQLAFDLETGASADLPELPPTVQSPKQDINTAIAARRKKIEDELEQSTQELLQTKNEKKINKIRINIRLLKSKLEDVEKFVTSRIGDSVTRNKFPDKKGIIERLDVSITGLPMAWVMWPQEYEEEPNSPEEHNIGTLTNLSSASRGEK
ncbi:hypothetical protein QUA70_12490 [Microcoleus sp. LAD1_D5]